MANVRALLITQGQSMLPADRYVNTFHFSNAEPYGDHSAAINSALQTFVNGNNISHPLAYYLSGMVLRGTNLGEIRTYNMADLEPREPLIYPFTVGAAAASAQPYPEEIACCISVQGDPPHTPSRRGRIYFGPINEAAGAYAVGTVRPASTFRADLNKAAQTLAGTTLGWSVYSTKLGSFTPITNGWVDDAWDVQRKRGIDESARSVWP